MKPLNDELIDEVLARIEADPDSWDQNSYFEARKNGDGFCGTTSCFAGHALLLSGWTVELQEIDWRDKPWVHVSTPDGKAGHAYIQAAADLLGFTEDEANRIFYFTQTKDISELRRAIDRIRAERAEINKDVTPG